MPFALGAPFAAVIWHFAVPIRPVFWGAAAFLFGLAGVALNTDVLGWFTVGNYVAEAAAGLVLGFLLMRSVSRGPGASQ